MLLLLFFCFCRYFFFFFNDTATTEIYTLSLHDALPISCSLVTIFASSCFRADNSSRKANSTRVRPARDVPRQPGNAARSEEHTSELQSLAYLVCRLLLEKKKKSLYIEGQHTPPVHSISR